VLVLAAQQPVRNLQVTLRGKTYDIPEDVTTVRDLQALVDNKAGKSTTSTSVIFGGKRLSANDILSEVGVSDGAVLNMVPGTSSKKKSSSSSSSGKKSVTADDSDSTKDVMQEYLKQAGLDPEKLEEMLQGSGMGDGEMPSMKESMEMMTDMMNSPLFQEYMNDPEKLEQSRQMILNNPMLKSAMASMPGMSELLNDPEGFRQAMQAAANMYKSMDPEQLMNMMGGPGAGGGMPPGGPGLFDAGTLDSPAALDELDEDD